MGPIIARASFTSLGRAHSGGGADDARGAGERDGEQSLDGEQSVGGERSREGRNARQCEATPACEDNWGGKADHGEEKPAESSQGRLQTTSWGRG